MQPASILALTRASQSRLSEPVRSSLSSPRRYIQTVARPRLSQSSFIRQWRPPQARFNSTFRPSFAQRVWILFKAHPIAITATLGAIGLCGGVLTWTTKYYSGQNDKLAPYPEPVAKLLRKALFYTDIQPNVKVALEYWKRALSKADEVGMDPFSDEVLGIKVKVAEMLDQAQLPHKALEVLELTRKDCLERLESQQPSSPDYRKRMLKWMIRLSAAIVDRISRDQPDKAIEYVEQSMEHFYAEIKERKGLSQNLEGLVDDEKTKAAADVAIQRSEIASLSYRAGLLYSQQHQFEIAAEAFLAGLSVLPDKNSCKGACFMSEIFESFLLRYIIFESAPSSQREEWKASAERWSHNTLDITEKVAAKDRSIECDLACATVFKGLATLTIERGDIDGGVALLKKALKHAKKAEPDGPGAMSNGLRMLLSDVIEARDHDVLSEF